MSLIIGEISYTNIRPMFYYADRESLKQAGCEFVPAIPSKLNKDMERGLVDVGGISSFSYGEHSEEYKILPDLSVSSTREVGSIFLFSKHPIDKLDGKSIALTSSSATSVNLLKIILQKFYQLNVGYQTTFPEYSQMMSEHDGCLLIGDDAILAKFSLPPDIYCYDLGELWKHFTGLPMTYAVFAVREEAWKNQSLLLADVHREFLNSKQQCIESGFEEMIQSIQFQLGGSFRFWKDYFSNLNYELSEKHLEGLHRFYELSFELNLLKKKVQNISIWNPAGNFHSV
ncbi:menaquinone biosynthetic enzyme MqnA/MqnD family protein [Salipaludibacillus aurantiacus]|uniref:Chorismate dehydratase n=1 Tax=Salipaludibacillus aurantiacus TaxID=1601833 RepID=A0A1H9P8B5_9BACI|nr:menaquinone biosynthesis protein [Salipaludibacillus aurantiacus]SER44452.1 chorismate dehydratase [Salipaludibacillus aurantiacus]